MKNISVKIENEVVTVSLDRLTKRDLEGELAKLQAKKYMIEKKKNQLDSQSQRLQFELTNLSKQILVLNSQEARKMIEDAEHQKEIDVQKHREENEKRLMKQHIGTLNAEQILLEFFGQDIHDKFMEQRELVFEAKDGATYKINVEGTVFRKEDEGWKPVCLIRPRELPLPDFIIAAITSVKNFPETYAPNVRRR
jgi:hypothetical protein